MDYEERIKKIRVLSEIFFEGGKVNFKYNGINYSVNQFRLAFAGAVLTEDLDMENKILKYISLKRLNNQLVYDMNWYRSHLNKSLK